MKVALALTAAALAGSAALTLWGWRTLRYVLDGECGRRG